MSGALRMPKNGTCDLTAKNLELAQKFGFLDIVCLAQTISDALEVVCTLGERYLRVDSLCII